MDDPHRPQFQAHDDCARCPLHAGCRSVGIAAGASPRSPTRRHDTALLVVGEAPGRSEDAEGKFFVGQAGDFLHRVYLDVLKLPDLADIYLTNACRCRPSNNTTPTKGQIHTCRPWLIDDIRVLQALYKEVVILCVGASAAESILSTRLTAAFVRQGERQVWGWEGTEGLQPCRVFTTFHPANLGSGRNPSRLAAIRDHLRLLHTYLALGHMTSTDIPSWDLCPAVPSYPIHRMSLDIETYGKVSTYPPQTCFHPARSVAWDRPKDLVLTVAICWRDAVGGERLGVFNFLDSRHRVRLLQFLRALAKADGDIVGQNIKFDLMYLRYADPRFHAVLNPRLRITELSVLNYLHSEQRPERGLKALAPLLAVAKYSEEEADGGFRYPSVDDPDLYTYNAKDAWATLRAAEELESRIARDYPRSPKLSPFSRAWYSRLIWTCLSMEETGVAFDRDALDRLDFRLVLEMELAKAQCWYRWDLPIAGKGSRKPVLSLFERAVEEADLVGDARVELTDVRKEISVNQRNTALLLEHLPADTVTRSQLRAYREFKGLEKIVTSYARPMLHGTNKSPVNCRLIYPPLRSGWNVNAQIAYPSWFPVPSLSGDEDQAGGTMQGRITSKGPACQTLPKPIKGCLCSRFKPGFLMGIDLSQIELRVAALLSGDRVMIEEYNKPNPDLHTQTAKLLIQAASAYLAQTGRDRMEVGGTTYTFSELNEFLASENPRQWKTFDAWRQRGKTTNFLIIYGGTGRKLWATLSEDLQVDLPLAVCDEVVAQAWRRYTGLKDYHDALLEEAKSTGRLELPLTGQSRMFLGSRRAVDQTYHNEILNFKGQTVAANVMLDLQGRLGERLAGLKWPVCMGLNIYDAIYIDGPRPAYPVVRKTIESCFRRSEYYEELQKVLGRSVPIDYNIETLVMDD